MTQIVNLNKLLKMSAFSGVFKKDYAAMLTFNEKCLFSNSYFMNDHF